MRHLVLTAVLAFAGCPPRPQPVPPPVPVLDLGTPPDLAWPDYHECAASLLVTPDDVCDGLFTREGLACVRCTGASGCLDTIDVIYCVVGNCTSDWRCGWVADLPEPPPDGRPEAQPKLRRYHRRE